MSNLNAEEYKTFESIKLIRENGTEFWYARELAKVLDYTEWRNFQKVVDRAILACKNSGFAVSDHFVEVNKMIEIGKGGKRKTIDFELTRYACYLIVQNGDPRKEIIEMGATLPEDLPVPEKSIQTIEREEIRKLRNSKKKLMLDE